jgi:hypothetical protein
MDGLDEVARLGKVVGHVRRVALVHTDCGEGVLGDMLLRRPNRYMDKSTKSRRHNCTAQLRQRIKEQHPGRAPASTAMADRHEENAKHYLTGG